MSSRIRGPLLSFAALALVVASCSSGESTEPSTLPATTASSTTTTSTTTTTTTLPPGLQAQQLVYGLADRQLLEYEAEHDVTISIFDPTGLIGGEESTSVRTVAVGDLRTLVLAGSEPGVFEVVQEFAADEASTTVSFGGTKIDQEMEDDELATMDISALPLMLQADGSGADELPGAPGYFQTDNRAMDILEFFGPVFGQDPVDVGDSWTTSVRDPALDEVIVVGTVTGEVETDDGFAFTFEIAGTVPALPLTFDLDDVIEQGLVPEDLAAISSFDLFGEDMTFSFTDQSLEASGTFDPIRGVLIEYAITSTLDFVVALSLDGELIEIEYSTAVTSEYSLTEVTDASGFDVTSVLDQFELDPYDLAAYALPVLPDYYFETFDQDVWDVLVSKLEVTTSEIVAGIDAVRYVTETGDGVDVLVITNGGNYRGDPYLAAGVAGYWADREPTRVTVNDRNAYRVVIEGEEWLFWNSDTHMYAAIGPRATAVDVVGEIMDSVDVYLWEAGDCLDFGDFDGALPYSPFGGFGLTHCSVDHQYEVLYSEVLEDGPDAPLPDDLTDHMAKACGARFFEHTGAYPLTSALGMVQYRPDSEEWDRGARYIACVIGVYDEDGIVVVDSRLDGAGTQLPIELEPGVCLSGSVPVDCDQPHEAEIISIGQYDAPADAPRPDFADVYDELEELCSMPLEEYGVTEGPSGIAQDSITDMYLGWENEVRTYFCVAYAEDDDEMTVSVVGSFAGDWEEAPEQVDA